jgi:DNA-binding NarL/FixJ family response regulator
VRRVLIVDDDPILREGLVCVIASMARFETCGQAQNGQDAIEAAGEFKPHVILMDLRMPRMDGFDATTQIARWHPTTPVLIHSAFGGKDNRDRARRAGAAGFIRKGASAITLRTALRAVSRGGQWWHDPVPQRAAGADCTDGREGQNPGAARLPTRQREILELTITGHPAKSIADSLGLSVRTVEFHRAALRARFKVRSTAELIHAAVAGNGV